MPDEITWMADPVPVPSAANRDAARARQAAIARPAGALGVLDAIVVTLAGLQRSPLPQADTVPAVVFAADHGVAAETISRHSSTTTVAMLRELLNGGAAIAVMARELGLKLTVIDAGTFATEPVCGVITDKPCCGTHDTVFGPAMTEQDLAHALAAGRRAIMRVSSCADLVLLGEVGVANTTAAAAVAAAIIGLPVGGLVRTGAGLDAVGLAHKADVISRALVMNGLADQASDPMVVLARVGGLEIAALTGAMIAAAQMGLPVLVDGFIVTVAALAACRIVPAVRPWLIFSHMSAEHGHARVLAALEAEPIAALGMGLGEGTGAAAVLPLIRLACALHRDMKTRGDTASGPRTPA